MVKKSFFISMIIIGCIINAQAPIRTPKFDKFLVKGRLETQSSYFDRVRALSTELMFHVATLMDFNPHSAGIISNAEIIISKLINDKISSVETVLNELIINAPVADPMKYFDGKYKQLKTLLPDSDFYYFAVPTLPLPDSVVEE